MATWEQGVSTLKIMLARPVWNPGPHAPTAKGTTI